MPLPTFFVIGAAKSGTTALYSYLRQHPEVFLPLRQEPSWFSFAGQDLAFTAPDGSVPSVNRNAIVDRSTYEALYSDAGGARAIGDVSPVYLYWPGTAERLAAEVPTARIVVLLRHPVDRAYSAFMHARREDREPIHDFRAALDAEPGRIAANCGFIWRYADLGRYAPQLSRWLQVFSREQIMVETYDTFAADPGTVCRKVQAFIGVDRSFVPSTETRHNVSGLPRSRVVRRLLRSDSRLARTVRSISSTASVERIKRFQTRVDTALLQRVPLDSNFRAELTSQWRSDIEEIADVVDLDLHHWLEDKSVPSS